MTPETHRFFSDVFQFTLKPKHPAKYSISVRKMYHIKTCEQRKT